ncbi:MAG: TetR/AcrR family transcriptional regulator [Hyphomicrobiaceae bacterium]
MKKSPQVPKKKSTKNKSQNDPQKQQRLNPREREKLIVEVAIEFFAEHGFQGTTRQLAERVGITQPLLFRYFPTKEALIERVYEEVYVSRWNNDWDQLLRNRRLTLIERLIEFYRQYAGNVYDYVWVRTFIYSGLSEEGINDRYVSFIKKRLLVPVCIEMRRENDLPTVSKVPICEEELELAWSMHGMFFYRAVRGYIYNIPMVQDVDKSLENDVRIFMKGAPAIQKNIIRNAKT